MLKRVSCLAALTLLFSAWPLVVTAQTSTPPSPTPPPHGRQEPCWRQAGIDRSVMEQHHAIEHDAHSQIDAVCENTTLTPQQRQQQAREIHQQAKQKMDALLTPDQQRALRSCQEARTGERPHEGHHGGGAGPCGRDQSPQAPASGPTGKAGGSNPHQPENNSPPQN
jgi:Spy/CpxP family protein refolding chaperone